jgi:hypothetical protein
MNCKAKVRDKDGTYRQCQSSAKVLGLCINHYTMIAYGKKVFHTIKYNEGVTA